MKRLCAIAAVILLSSAMFFVPVCAGGDQVTRPSKGMWSGTTYILAQNNCPDDHNLFVSIGKGVSTLSGASDYFAMYCVKLATGEGVEGDAIITAANGDALFLKITINFNFANGTWLQDEIIYGGTGRFADAEGQTASGGTLTPTGAAQGIWEGASAGEISF